MADTPKRASDVLREAKALISTPERWTKRAFARNAEHIPCDTMNPDAECFCALGAVYRVSMGGTRITRWLVMAAGKKPSGTCADPNKIIDWNDAKWRKHADVLRLYDRAIALAETEEANG